MEAAGGRNLTVINTLLLLLRHRHSIAVVDVAVEAEVEEPTHKMLLLRRHPTFLPYLVHRRHPTFLPYLVRRRLLHQRRLFLRQLIRRPLRLPDKHRLPAQVYQRVSYQAD